MPSKARSRDQKSPASRNYRDELSAIEWVGNCVADRLSLSGRIALSELQNIRLILDQEAFIQYIRRPALVGSAILSGTIEASTPAHPAGKNRTVTFDVAGLSKETEAASETLQNAIYPLVKPTLSPTSNGRFMIGRDSSNDIIMPDIALSKYHAAIEVTNRSYHLSDCGSTNGTMLNGQRLDQTPQPLKDGDIISFARYEFTFIYPMSLYNKLGMDLVTSAPT